MLVKVIRPYGGQEGRRVKPGTLFSVDAALDGFQTITTARWNQLRQMGLATAATPGDETPAAPNARRTRQAPDPANKVEPDSKPPRLPRQPSQRAGARKRSQEDTPKEPRPLARRPGSPAGRQEPAASSSPEDRQAGSVTLKQRGTRRGSGGSPSITPGSPPPTPDANTSSPDSAPGLTSSMPATPSGGPASDPSENSAAFD